MFRVAVGDRLLAGHLVTRAAGEMDVDDGGGGAPSPFDWESNSNDGRHGGPLPPVGTVVLVKCYRTGWWPVQVRFI